MKEVDYNELTMLDKQLIKIARSQFPNLAKKHVKQATAKGVKVVRATFKGFGKKDKINPFTIKGKTKSKTYKTYASTFTSSKKGYKKGDDFVARIWNKNPLTHIIENEHIHTGHKPNKVKGRAVKGFHTYEHAQEKVTKEFYNHLANKMVDDVRKAINK